MRFAAEVPENVEDLAVGVELDDAAGVHVRDRATRPRATFWTMRRRNYGMRQRQVEDWRAHAAQRAPSRCRPRRG